MFTKPTRWQDGLSEYRESNGAMSYCILGNVLKWTLLLLQRTLVPDCWLANGLVGKWRHHCLQSDPDWTLKALDFLFLEMKQKGRNPEFYVAVRDSGFTSKPNPETRMKNERLVSHKDRLQIRWICERPFGQKEKAGQGKFVETRINIKWDQTRVCFWFRVENLSSTFWIKRGWMDWQTGR